MNKDKPPLLEEAMKKLWTRILNKVANLMLNFVLFGMGSEYLEYIVLELMKNEVSNSSEAGKKLCREFLMTPAISFPIFYICKKFGWLESKDV